MIRTRPPEVQDVYGSGEHLVALTDDELDLISALLCCAKLGPRKYQEAARSLLEIAEEITGEQDYPIEAFDRVRFTVSVLDSNLNILDVIDGDNVVFNL